MHEVGFMTASSDDDFQGLQSAIDELEELSTVFVKRWIEGRHEKAAGTTKRAMKCFDHIVGEIMRERDDRKGLGTYAGSAFETEMSKIMGSMVKPATLADQRAMVARGLGEGALPADRGAPKSIAVSTTLNKIKHRNRGLINFRLENANHIFVVCPNDNNGVAESIVEFDVGVFCRSCTSVASSL